MNKFSVVSIFVLGAMLSSCGGGGGGGSTTVAPGGGTPVADERMGGIWQGTSTSGGVSQSYIGVTTDDGRLRFLSESTEGQVIGSIGVSNQNQVSGTGFAVAPLGFTWIDGSTVTSVNVSGTIAERSTFDGSWTAGTGETGTFNMDFDPIYNRSSSITKVQGTYTSFDETGNATGSYTIDSSGGISGQDFFGCIYGGAISIIDSNFNVYNMSLSVSNCGEFNGTYNGLAGLGDFNATDDELLISVDNGTWFVILIVLR